jgi:hypothetical protein
LDFSFGACCGRNEDNSELLGENIGYEQKSVKFRKKRAILHLMKDCPFLDLI